MTQYRPTWAEIRLDRLIHNLNIAQSLHRNKHVIPVIKANAYGHDVLLVMKALYEAGIRYVAVSLLEEALELREMYKDIGILMMGPILPSQFEVASQHRISITLYDKSITEAVLTSDLPLICHLKCDTGMSRYGLKDINQIVMFADQLMKHPKIELEGIYSHFATANAHDTFQKHQIERFLLIVRSLKTKPKMIHLSNSSATFHEEADFTETTHMRLGISLYGLSLDEPKPNLKPVMSLKTKIVQIKTIHKGECVGYRASYCAKEDETIAILPIGYADGWIRKNKNGMVQIHQSLYPMVGRVCMDACFVKVDDTVQTGDTVILFGDMISMDDVAKRLNTIHYEVATQISYRVPRIALEGDNHD